MSHYKPYPAYRDSGVEWIGQVPEHWDIARIKRTSSLRTDRCTDAPEGSQYIGLEDVEAGTGQYRPTEGSARQNEDSTVGVFKIGDVLYGKLRPYLKKAIVSDADGVCSTEFLVLRPKTVLAPWLHQWLLTTGATQQIEAGCEGSKMPRADWEHVGSIHLPSPDSSEQAEILEVLDRETARFDALIAKKTRFIELLKEKRQALITHAVTKGLDTNVPMRDSMSEWIGEVPEHWRVCSLGYLSRISTGGTPDRKNDSYWNGEIPWVKTGEINYKIISDTEERITDAGLSNSATFIAEPGTILMAMYGMGVTRGRVAVLGIPASFNQACAAISCSSGVHNWYVFYCLCAAYRFIRDLGNEASQVNLNLEIVSKIKVPVPPLLEQEEIEKHLVAQLQKLDAIEQRVSNSISLIKERRSAFITAAVTGQIDLRESA
ncbi:restriction endonuclease subunit S [Aeromonas caviae]|uniref:restriction endonuclease subunit S n=1 Tax=Aeromonas caviae TaxID=648 RepID=UPI00403F1D16